MQRPPDMLDSLECVANLEERHPEYKDATVGDIFHTLYKIAERAIRIAEHQSGFKLTEFQIVNFTYAEDTDSGENRRIQKTFTSETIVKNALNQLRIRYLTIREARQNVEEKIVPIPIPAAVVGFRKNAPDFYIGQSVVDRSILVQQKQRNVSPHCLGVIENPGSANLDPGTTFHELWEARRTVLGGNVYRIAAIDDAIRAISEGLGTESESEESFAIEQNQ